MKNNQISTVNENSGAYAISSENLRKVKDIAAFLLETPIRYAIFDYRHAKDIDSLSGSGYDDAMQEAVQRYKDIIEKTESIDSIIRIMNEPCRLFFYFIQNTLSPDELGSLLLDIWMCSKKPNKDAIPLPALIEWFKKAGRESLMDAEELAYYNSLPDEFPVYRGMGAKSCKKGISYTLSLETAERFTKRFWKTGYVLTGTAKKKDVLAYFNSRNEQEVLIEPKNISGLHEMQAGLSLDSPA